MSNPCYPIVFIGPVCAGKSTLARALSIELGVRYVPLDAIRFYYFLQSGFSFIEMMDKPDSKAVVRYWKPFELEAVERVVSDFSDSVLDFGAGQAHYTDPERITRLESILEPIPNVLHVVPSLDADRAEQICIERDKHRSSTGWDSTWEEFTRAMVRSECFRCVAKHTIVTGDRTPQQSLEDVLAALVRA